ncbi:MAG: sigma 54-interacting transcriptional regulator, partial [Thermoanaerobaculia bacterium]
PRVQVELLRVLEEKVVTRVGGQTLIPVDFRVIAATNQDLETLIERGEFREDLFWRLNVFAVQIPPLRERPEDIPPLAEHFLEIYTRSMNRKPMRFSSETFDALKNYHWPGNIRELQNAIERAVVVGTPPAIKAEDLPVRVTSPAAQPGPMALRELERAHILRVLDTCSWNITRAASLLEVDRGTLYNKIEKHGFRRPVKKS